MEKTICGVKTKNGIAALWESGGFGIKNNDEGSIRLIACRDGRRPDALYVNLDAEANGEHALVAIHENYFVMDAELVKGKFHMILYRVRSIIINEKDVTIRLRLVNRCLNGKWEAPLSGNLNDLVEAAYQKVQRLNCRDPLYIFWPKPIRMCQNW